MPRAAANGIEIEYELSGPEGGRPLLMIHGIGAQLIRWPPALCEAFHAAGFRTIRFDNRDVGLSSHLHGAPVPDIAAVLAARKRGEAPELPYTVGDMAGDAAGLLGAIGVERAHVLGVSLGGAIAQTLAVEHPARVASLNIVMATSNNPDLPPSRPEAMAALTARAPDPAEDEEAYLAAAVALARALGSPGYPADEATLRAGAREAGRRAYDPAGVARQTAASRGAADRRAALARLGAPTLVIHGADDPLIPLAAGQDIAAAVPGAWLLVLGGMGHDLPAPLFDVIVSAVAANARRAG